MAKSEGVILAALIGAVAVVAAAILTSGKKGSSASGGGFGGGGFSGGAGSAFGSASSLAPSPSPSVSGGAPLPASLDQPAGPQGFAIPVLGGAVLINGPSDAQGLFVPGYDVT